MVCNDNEDVIITVHIHFNSQRQWLIILWKEINGIEPDVQFFAEGSNCLHKSIKHQLRNTEKEENIMCLSEKTMGFVLQGNFHVLYQHSAERVCNRYVSKNWQFGAISVSLLQIIVFMCYGIMLNKWVLQTYQPDFMKSPLVYHPGHRAQVWRFFSYMFMHVGYVH